jgi:hypothetical protein
MNFGIVICANISRHLVEAESMHTQIKRKLGTYLNSWMRFGNTTTVLKNKAYVFFSKVKLRKV